MMNSRDFTEAELSILDITRRNMLTAVACNGHTYKQVAAEHNVPVGTVKSRINRARIKIANMRQAEDAV